MNENTVTIGDAKDVCCAALGIKVAEFSELQPDIQNGHLVAARSVARLITVDGRNPADLTEFEQVLAAGWAKVGAKRGLQLVANGDTYEWKPDAEPDKVETSPVKRRK